MKLHLNTQMQQLLGELFQAAPLEKSLTVLVGPTPRQDAAGQIVLGLAEHPLLQQRPALRAGLWLYVDDLERSHRISQQHEDDATCNFWHGIMHRREGEFANSHHWFRRVGAHPVIDLLGGDYDPHQFIDEVAAAHGQELAPAHLQQRQREEWAALLQWSAR